MAESSENERDLTEVPKEDSLAGGEAPQRPAPRPRGAQSVASVDDDADISFDPVELEREGDASNTPSQKTSSQKTAAGGEDWLTISLYLKHHDFSSLQAKLDAAQDAAKRGKEPNDEVEFADHEFIVSPTGTRLGDRRKGAWMAWRLQADVGATLFLMEAAEPMGDQPNGSVRITSNTLMEYGTLPAWEMVQKWLASMGAELREDKLSRVL